MTRTELKLELTEFAVKCTNCTFEQFKVGQSVNCDACMGRAITAGHGRGGRGDPMADPITDINPHRTVTR